MKPFIVGVTGNIGGGKTRLLKKIEALGFKIINADTVAKRIIYTKEHEQFLIKILGAGIIKDGNYVLPEIGKIIFSNDFKRKKLEEFAMPYILKEVKRIIKESGEFIVFIENAMLYEQGWISLFDFIICISCKKEVSVARTMLSKNMEQEDVLKIIKSQVPSEVKEALADLAIDTTYFSKDNDCSDFIIHSVKHKIRELQCSRTNKSTA